MIKFFNYDEYYIRYFLQRVGLDQGRTEYHLDPGSHNLFSINSLMSLNPHGLILDRTGHISHPLSMSVMSPYHWENSTRNFQHVVQKTCQELVQSHNGRFIIKWSGGIDSTVSLIGLLQCLDKDRILICCNDRSVKEFPDFYDKIIKDRYETIDTFHEEHFGEDFVTVSGDNGDTVWAVIDQDFFSKNSEYFDVNWKIWAKNSSIDFNFVEEFCSWSGRTIDTVLELRAWFYLNCKWQEKTMQGYTLPRSSIKNHRCFYNTNDWQIWSMNNLDKIIGKTWQSYKMPAKKFIYDFFPDKNYLDNKSKEISNGMLLKWNFLDPLLDGGPCLAITDSWKKHSLPSLPLFKCEEFIGWNNEQQLVPDALLEQIQS
jgi:hypothetical protein